jgi:hypothetical protein
VSGTKGLHLAPAKHFPTMTWEPHLLSETHFSLCEVKWAPTQDQGIWGAVEESKSQAKCQELGGYSAEAMPITEHWVMPGVLVHFLLS